MASRTISPIVVITVCLFLVCNTNAFVTTPGPSDSVSTSVPSAETTLSPALDVTNTTFTNTNTATANASEPSQSSISTTTDAATTHNTANVSESSTIKVISTSGSNYSTTAPLTGTSVDSHNRTSGTTASGTTHDVLTSSTTKEIPTPQHNGTETTPNGTNTTSLSEDYSMKYSEIILTSIFSTILVIVVLVVLSFGLKRCLRGRSQYYHHPLHETSYESDRHAPPDDTLVISGGLYDAPRIYNPNMTVLEEEEPHNDYVSFSSRPGQFRLEFLPGDKDTDTVFNEPQSRNV